jgi:hypothetical protein
MIDAQLTSRRWDAEARKVFASPYVVSVPKFGRLMADGTAA